MLLRATRCRATLNDDSQTTHTGPRCVDLEPRAGRHRRGRSRPVGVGEGTRRHATARRRRARDEPRRSEGAGAAHRDRGVSGHRGRGGRGSVGSASGPLRDRARVRLPCRDGAAGVERLPSRPGGGPLRAEGRGPGPRVDGGDVALGCARRGSSRRADTGEPADGRGRAGRGRGHLRRRSVAAADAVPRRSGRAPGERPTRWTRGSLRRCRSRSRW